MIKIKPWNKFDELLIYCIVDQTLQRIQISYSGLIIIMIKKNPGMEPEI